MEEGSRVPDLEDISPPDKDHICVWPWRSARKNYSKTYPIFAAFIIIHSELKQ